MENFAGLLDDDLGALTEAFSLCRGDGSSRRSIPVPLRRMAVAAVRRIESVPKVARACGVTPQTIRNWVLEIPPPARRLAIVTTPESSQDAHTEALAKRVEVPPPATMPAASPACFVFRLNAGVMLEATPEQALWLVRQLGGGTC